jgi:pimeloyl-ACP methyl ester carboxylesterase
MNLHSLARSCPASRALMIERIEKGRWAVEDAAEAAGLSTRPRVLLAVALAEARRGRPARWVVAAEADDADVTRTRSRRRRATANTDDESADCAPFLPAGAEAFKRDIPNAVVRFFDTGHFALETHAREIAAAMREFLTA